jgi:hypothetical protein
MTTIRCEGCRKLFAVPRWRRFCTGLCRIASSRTREREN